MVRITRLIAFFACLLALTSCEEITTTEGLPYEEKLVVRGILSADSTIMVRISRTLPLTGAPDSTQAFLRDVSATITDAEGTHTMEYVGHGGFYTVPGLTVKAGMSYSFEAKWRTLRVTSSTRIPSKPVVQSAYFDTVERGSRDYPYKEFRLRALVAPQPGTALGIDRAVILTDRYYSNDIYGLVGLVAGDTDSGSVIAPGPGVTGEMSFAELQLARVVAYDAPYLDYFNTRQRSSDDDIFLSQPLPIKWNVNGDGIGIFIGRNAVTYTP